MENSMADYLNASLWPSYALQQPSMLPSQHSFQPSYHSVALPFVETAEPSGESYRLPPTLYTHPIHPSLKRTFSKTDLLSFGESTHEREEHPKINQGHHLMSFTRMPLKHTILDSQGHVSRVNLSAQLHGMFFLSELATTASEAQPTQPTKPELTCYRRNLFQISGGVTMSRGTLSYLTDRGERLSIMSMEINISATESVDGNVVKLIVIPWKTPPPNSPEIASGPEREPSAISLQTHHDTFDRQNETIVSPFAFRRLQFRIATANNGRRRELQQHFVLHLKVIGILADGSRVDMCESSTAPIVVRGRSPRNFQARKEIPLMGSSSSRGNPPELQITMSPVNTLVETKTQQAIDQGVDQTFRLPGARFTFESNKSEDPICLSSTFAPWERSTSSDRQTALAKYPLTPMTLGRYFHEQPVGQVDTCGTISSLGSESPSSAKFPYQSYQPILPSSNKGNTQTPLTPMTVGRYYREQQIETSGTTSSPGPESPSSTKLPYQNYHPIPPSGDKNHTPNICFDDNPRPSKSPRLVVPSEPKSLAYVNESDCCFTQSFNSANTFPTFAPDEEYLDPTDPTHWKNEIEAAAIYDLANQVPLLPPYEYPDCLEESRRGETQQPQLYTWGTHGGEFRHGLST
ncbi:hypothetical protein K3495_g5219 [Podosphaera aphanis]|nr:hypothetical protein K3495_g5219 [Podosphaera aphanis]